MRGGLLYVATASPGSTGAPNDHFLFVTDALLPTASALAPWAKIGLVATGVLKPFIGGESTTEFCGWFNAPVASPAVKSATSSGQMEGTIDLAAAFGSVPATIYVAAAAYATADGGQLTAQCPLGNSDGNIDPAEFLSLPIAAIQDENADGTYDRLDPALGFVVTQVARSMEISTISWASVPGRTYQAESCDQLGGTWTPLNPPITAGTGQLTLSTSDSTALPSRFYRVQLVSP